MLKFSNRQAAGRALAAALESYATHNPVILGLARGGVPVAFEVAKHLNAALEVWVVRKLCHPSHPELGVGAVAEGGHVYLNRDIMSHARLVDADVADLVRAQLGEVEARITKYRAGQPPPGLEGRTVIMVDDGIATSGTVRAAIGSIRAHHPKRLVLAVPVAVVPVIRSLEHEVDHLVCLHQPRDLLAIGLHYDEFSPVSDDEVVRLLERARKARAEAAQPAL